MHESVKVHKWKGVSETWTTFSGANSHDHKYSTERMSNLPYCKKMGMANYPDYAVTHSPIKRLKYTLPLELYQTNSMDIYTHGVCGLHYNFLSS